MASMVYVTVAGAHSTVESGIVGAFPQATHERKEETFGDGCRAGVHGGDKQPHRLRPEADRSQAEVGRRSYRMITRHPKLLAFRDVGAVAARDWNFRRAFKI